jgi:hypothetical protein
VDWLGESLIVVALGVPIVECWLGVPDCHDLSEDVVEFRLDSSK